MRMNVKASYLIDTPLGTIPREEWPEVVDQKIRWAREKFGVDFKVAVGIIDDFDKNDIWGFLGESREHVVERQFQIPPQNLDRLTRVYHQLRPAWTNPIFYSDDS